MKKLIPMVYLNTRDQQFDVEMKGKVCGIMCVAMILSTHEKDFGTTQGLINEAKGLGAYLLGIGWDHRGLVHVLVKYGIRGRRFEVRRFSMKEEMWSLKDNFENQIKGYLDDEKALIVSVDKGFRDNLTSTHLVVLHGYECNESGEVVAWIISDPSSVGSKQEDVPAGYFKEYFRGLGVVIGMK